MGLLEKQQTKRLIRPSAAAIGLTPASIGEMVRDFVQTRGTVGVLWRGEYQVTGGREGPWKISFVGGLGPSWEAVLDVAQATEHEETVVTLQLVHWFTHHDAIKDAARFKELRSRIFEQLAERDPDFRKLEGGRAPRPMPTRDMLRAKRARSDVDASLGVGADATKVDREHGSETCSPSFAALHVSSSTSPGSYEPLDARWESVAWPLPGGNETVVARLNASTILASGRVDGKGLPATESSDGPFTAGRFFRGSGPLLVTDRRILGLLLLGKYLDRDIDADLGSVLAISVPYENVREIGLNRVREFGGMKVRNLYLWLLGAGAMGLNIENSVRDDGRAKKIRYIEVLNGIATAASNALLPTATGDSRSLLERAQRLESESDGDNVRFVLQARV